MSVQELGELLAVRGAGGGEDVQFVDVREEREAQLAALPHFQLLPLSRCRGRGGGGCQGMGRRGGRREGDWPASMLVCVLSRAHPGHTPCPAHSPLQV